MVVSILIALVVAAVVVVLVLYACFDVKARACADQEGDWASEGHGPI